VQKREAADDPSEEKNGLTFVSKSRPWNAQFLGENARGKRGASAFDDRDNCEYSGWRGSNAYDCETTALAVADRDIIREICSHS
jgi:hypothetical protein